MKDTAVVESEVRLDALELDALFLVRRDRVGHPLQIHTADVQFSEMAAKWSERDNVLFQYSLIASPTLGC